MLFALFSLLFFQDMGSEDFKVRERASDRAECWLFALLAPDSHPNPEVNCRIYRAKAGYPRDLISFESWLRKKDTTLWTWHEWVIRNRGSQLYSNLEIQEEIAYKTKLPKTIWFGPWFGGSGVEGGKGLAYDFLDHFPGSGLAVYDLSLPLSEFNIVAFDKMVRGGGKIP